MADNHKKLEDYMVDLAIYWLKVEELTLSQINERLTKYFGIKATDSALSQRLNRRKKDFTLGIKPTRAIPNPDDMTDEALLSWFGALLYEEVYISKAKSDTNNLRKNVDLAIKIMRAKKDLTGVEDEKEDEFTKQFRELLKKENRAEA